MEWKKGLISGITAGIVMLIIGSAFMMIPGVTEWYTEKFPEMMAPTAMSIMTVGVVLGGIFMGLVYSVINSAIPGEGARKGVNYGIMVWLLAGLTWPIMMMGFAPAYLWIAELINGLITYSIVGAVLAIIYGKL
jgi:MFS family permease